MNQAASKAKGNPSVVNYERLIQRCWSMCKFWKDEQARLASNLSSAPMRFFMDEKIIEHAAKVEVAKQILNSVRSGTTMNDVIEHANYEIHQYARESADGSHPMHNAFKKCMVQEWSYILAHYGQEPEAA